MNFEAAIHTIRKDFCNLFLAKYLKGKWGIVAGFITVPEYVALMRMELAIWQLKTCDNEWCDIVSTSGSTCPPGYMFIEDDTYGVYCSVGGCPPGQIPGTPACNICPPCNPCPPSAPCIPPDPRAADLTVVRYGSMAPPGTCVLNPALQACRRHNGWCRMNVNAILMSTFAR